MVTVFYLLWTNISIKTATHFLNFPACLSVSLSVAITRHLWIEKEGRRRREEEGSVVMIEWCSACLRL